MTRAEWVLTIVDACEAPTSRDRRESMVRKLIRDLLKDKMDRLVWIVEHNPNVATEDIVKQIRELENA